MKNSEDKRITKTRRNIKRTLTELLAEKSFEEITVTELCRRGETSRITFYTYYDDKYALIEEMFEDYIREADIDYHALQCQNNPDGDGLRGYENLLECILNLYYNNEEFFSHAVPSENPYLYSAFFRHILTSVDVYLRRHPQLRSRYPTRVTSALLCNGLMGVIAECVVANGDEETVRKTARAMYGALLRSELFEIVG